MIKLYTDSQYSLVMLLLKFKLIPGECAVVDMRPMAFGLQAHVEKWHDGNR